MVKSFKGTAWRFGDDIRADIALHYSPRVAAISDPKELAKMCMVGYDRDFPEKVKKGDFIVAGKNFAFGHMHPQFYHSIIGAGISAVIAESTGRRFFRDAINAGLPVIIHKGISGRIDEGDELRLDLRNGVIANLTKKEKITILKMPDILFQILDAGSLILYLKRDGGRNTKAS